MLRNAFVMKLKPGFAEEYKKRHDQLWPELESALKQAGISDYSIFLDERTGNLFAVQKLAENHSAGSLPDHPAVKKWWVYMKDIMDSNPDNSPVVTPLREVFYLE